MKGLFITFEGIDGAGKTTLLKKLYLKLKNKSKVNIICTREPGGNKISEIIRNIILDKFNFNIDIKTEILLYSAARRQNFISTILPNLKKGNIVLCDRFIDSFFVYQIFGRKFNKKEILYINNFIIGKNVPDLTFYLDINLNTMLKRNLNKKKDRLELEEKNFYKRIIKGYLYLFKKNYFRIKKIDFNKDFNKNFKKIYFFIIKKYKKFFKNI